MRRLTAIVSAGVLVAGCTACMVPSDGRATPASTRAEAPATVTQTVATTVDQPTVTMTVRLPAPTSAEPAPATTTERDDQPAPSTVPTGSQGGEVSDAEIRSQTAEAFIVVNTYWSNLFAEWEDDAGQPVQWWTPSLYRGDGFYDSARGDDINACGNSAPMNASFCPDGNGSGAVSWDLNRFRLEELIGDAPIFAIVAHEVGHAAQARFWHDGEGGATPNPSNSVAYEQQADCLAGATLSKAARDGYLTILPGDLDEITAFIWNLEADSDHGAPADRLAAFQLGYGTGDVESCLYNRGVPPAGL